MLRQENTGYEKVGDENARVENAGDEMAGMKCHANENLVSVCLNFKLT